MSTPTANKMSRLVNKGNLTTEDIIGVEAELTEKEEEKAAREDAQPKTAASEDVSMASPASSADFQFVGKRWHPDTVRVPATNLHVPRDFCLHLCVLGPCNQRCDRHDKHGAQDCSCDEHNAVVDAAVFAQHMREMLADADIRVDLSDEEVRRRGLSALRNMAGQQKKDAEGRSSSHP
jgi:hypothetical protein